MRGAPKRLLSTAPPRSFLKAENKHAAVHSAARPRPPQGQ